MSEFNNALVIAGGRWQVPVIEFLEKKNYIVHVVDPYPHAPGVLIADVHLKADVRDIEAIKLLVAEKKFELVITDQSDISVETVAEVAAYLKLRGNKIEVVKKFSNKYISRQYALDQKIPVPQFIKAINIEGVHDAISRIGLPVILKPADSQSSRGIFKIDADNMNDLENLTAQTFKESHQEYILVEEFFEGTELTAEGICSVGKHKTLAISMKKHFRTGIASELEYPAQLPTDIEEAIIKFNDQYVENSGLEFGITHAEYLYNKDSAKFCLVEIACRGGGSLISSDIAKWVSGIDPYEILLKDLLGVSTDVHAIRPLKRSAILYFFEYQNGIIESIEGLEAISKMEGIRLIQLDFKEGDRIKAASDDRSRQGFVIIFAENKIDLHRRLTYVNETLKVSIKNV